MLLPFMSKLWLHQVHFTAQPFYCSAIKIAQRQSYPRQKQKIKNQWSPEHLKLVKADRAFHLPFTWTLDKRQTHQLSNSTVLISWWTVLCGMGHHSWIDRLMILPIMTTCFFLVMASVRRFQKKELHFSRTYYGTGDPFIMLHYKVLLINTPKTQAFTVNSRLKCEGRLFILVQQFCEFAKVYSITIFKH